MGFEDNHLGFFTIFDGDFAKYIQDFAEKNSLVFDTLFPHIVGAPPTPVAKNAQAFYQWALEANHPPIGFYRAYPGVSVQDIRALMADQKSQSSTHCDGWCHMALRRLLDRRSPGSDGGPGPMNGAPLDLAEIQGFVLRGYAMPMVRHFLLTVATPGQARRQLGRLVNGDGSDAPQITTAEDWHVGFAPGPGDDPEGAPRRTPDYCLNVGITWAGLVALELEEGVPGLSF